MTESDQTRRCPVMPRGMWLLLSVVVLGLFLLFAVRLFKTYDHTVSVRGLCEREVMADRAIYPISYKEAGNDLVQLYASVNTKNQQIIQFLKENGFSEDEISVSAPAITDHYSDSYSSNAPSRYVIKSVITLYTTRVQAVIDLQSRQSALVEKGIAVGSGDTWENPVEYNFEGLNDIKPEMIEEANRNARTAAEQFARDYGSRLGKIVEANQGLFTIEPRDSNTPQVKRIRVVTSVTYNLR